MAGRLTVQEDPCSQKHAFDGGGGDTPPEFAPAYLQRPSQKIPKTPPIGPLIGLGRDGGDYGAAISGQFSGENTPLTSENALVNTLEAITKIGPGGAAGPVAEGLRSDDRRIRQSAIRAAGKAPDPSLAALAWLNVSLIRATGGLRPLALTSMGAKAIPAIARVAGDRSATVGARSAAIQAPRRAG